jgi:site-specific DNA recombinase
MVTPAPAAGTLTGEPVPVAIAARTSTLALQDPVASVRRQIRACEAWLPPGWFIAAVYSDVESGATDLDARSRTGSWRVLTDAGLPRDGGMADLLAEAASPSPRFAVVVCEDIERSARDTFNALRLEKELSRHGIPLFATDEPADIAGVNATTVLVRRVKQGVAEWYRLQLKEKVWKGFAEHNAEGWNIGIPPHCYQAERHPHPNPLKASQGRTKTRLIINPVTAPAVTGIFTWRVVQKLGVPTITARLNASPASYPPPSATPGWTVSAVRAILANPKYTGHQVFGRRRTRNGRRVNAPMSEWLWSPEPVHEPIVDMQTWKDAQDIGADHSTSRDHHEPEANPASRIYPYRGRVRCRDCQRRMTANPYPAHVYYRCPHNPASPRHVAAHPGRPRDHRPVSQRPGVHPAPRRTARCPAPRDRRRGPPRRGRRRAPRADHQAGQTAERPDHRPGRHRSRQPRHPGYARPHPRPLHRTPHPAHRRRKPPRRAHRRNAQGSRPRHPQ